jgi:hypothetical protein
MALIPRLLFRSGATAASLGAFALEKTAEKLRGLAGDGDSTHDRFHAIEDKASDAADRGAGRLRSLAGDAAEHASQAEGGNGRSDVPVERRGGARTVQPLIPPDKAPKNPAAPAGGDPSATSGTGPVPRRISNPKAAKKVRKREQAAAKVSRLEVPEAKRGAKPSTVKAENTPSERAAAKAGRAPAPMGSKDPAAS